MLKRLIALIGVMLMLSVLILPCVAAVDWSTYPTSNLIYPKLSSGDCTLNGLTFECTEDGCIKVLGIATSTFNYWFCQFISFPAGTYFFGYDTSCHVGANISLSDGSFFQCFGGSFTADSSFDISVYFHFESGKTYNDVFRVRLFKGSTDYPFSPCVTKYAFNAGVGEYTESFFRHCSFTALVIGSYPDTGSSYSHSIPFTPNFIYSGITFESLYAEVQAFLTTVSDPYWGYIDRVIIQMVWDDEYVFDYRTLSLYITGDYDVSYGQLYSTSGSSYSLNADVGTSNYKRLFVVDSNENTILTKQVDIWVGRPADLLTAFTIYAPSESYNNGYTDGYSVGYNEGESLGAIGAYNNGFIAGKAEGLELAQSGSWTELMLAVTEAPINTFQSLFNFEILGLDMRAAFGAILTLCVVLIVIKKVVL